MTTYQYEITRYSPDRYCVSEADGPTAPATGYYTTLKAAKDAVEKVATKHGITDLDWEKNFDDDTNAWFWFTEWDVE